ncbi:hypothetical protein JNW88_02580 [Micromonospora sp. ATA32]|nr:hypothetical protein [Micromonospora sp. ATA32]
MLADGRQAWTPSPRALPWGLIPAALAALLVALAWSITAAVQARKPTPSAPAQPVDSTATPA